MGRNTVARAELRAAIRRIERGGAVFDKPVVTTGCAAFDGHFGGAGLARAACHEIGGGAAAAFAAGLAGRALAGGGQLFWCQHDAGMRWHGALYGPGLAGFGIAPERCLHVRARCERDLLWAVEEIARSPAAACVVAEIGGLDLAGSRRLQLAIEAGGGILLLLRRGARDPSPIAAATRIEATPLPTGPPAVWRVALWRAKGAAPGSWDLRWHADSPTGGFRLASEAPTISLCQEREADEWSRCALRQDNHDGRRDHRQWGL